MSKRVSSAKSPTQRQLRAGELIRHALVEILQREELREPALSGKSITISEVRTTADLKQATVFCMPLGGDDEEIAVSALNRISPYLRGLLGRRIDMKFTPALKFLADASFSESRRINELLSKPEVARDLTGKES